MERKMDEILASQHQMLVRSGKPTDKVSDEKLAEMYSKHLAKVKNWLNEQPNILVLYLDYNAMLAEPDKSSVQINQFLGDSLNAEKMAAVIDPNLYRQRK
jgi:hypothetical protein